MNDAERQKVVERFEQNRRHSQQLFDGVRERAYYSRPIALRQPIVFYEGHFPGFNLNTLVKRALRRDGVDAHLEALFERGIDPESEDEARRADKLWPDPETVRQFVAASDDRVRNALQNAPLEDPDNPLLVRSEAVFTILEHEEMHQETFRYMVHRLPFETKRFALRESPVNSVTTKFRAVRIPRGTATIGTDRDSVRFGWDNEFESVRIDVPEFEIDVFPVTNEQFLDFVEAGGYGRADLWSADAWEWRRSNHVEHPLFWERADGKWLWRGMLQHYELPPSWPVYVTHAEAAAYARWIGKRLPTEAEYHRTAFGTPSGEERPFPWGADAPRNEHGNFGYQFDDPVQVGSYPAGQSAWGVHDLVGNGWEWTSSVFEPLAGFRAMASYPQYSADFFDGKHFVLKGASPATAPTLIRRSFRNWFRPTYPYVYAKFRCVKS